MKGINIAYILLLMACIAFFFSCQGKKVITSDLGEVTIKGKKERIVRTYKGTKGEKVSVELGTHRLPENFPADIPVYPDAKIEMSQVLSCNDQAMLRLISEDSLEQMRDFYLKNAQAMGWALGKRLYSQGRMTFVMEKDNRRMIIALIEKSAKVEATTMVTKK